MNADHPTSPSSSATPEDRDALLTAFALGELAGAERAEAERLLADPRAAAERIHVTEVREIATALRAGHEAEPVSRSADLRRAVLAALAAGPAAAHDDEDDARHDATPRGPTIPADAAAGHGRAPRGGWLGAVAGLAGLAAAALVTVTLLPSPFPPRSMRAERQVAQVDARGRDVRPTPLADEGAAPLAAAPRAAAAPSPTGSVAGDASDRGSIVGAIDHSTMQRSQARQDETRRDGVADRPAMAKATAAADGTDGLLAKRFAADAGPAPGGTPAAAAPASPMAGVPLRPAEPFGLATEQAASRRLAETLRDSDAGKAAQAAAGGGQDAGGQASQERLMTNGRAEREAVAPEARSFFVKEFAEAKPSAAADTSLGRAIADKQRAADSRATRETYAGIVENRFLAPADAPLSTFSIDVDTASYANVRRFLVAGQLPPRDAVRIEELVNYFRYDLPQPGGDAPFSVTVEAAGCPWHEGRRLVRVALQGRAVDRGARPAGNLVFLVDVSGSMRDADKLPLVKQALSMLVEQLGEDDRVAIVTYAGEAGLVLPPTGGEQKDRILAAIDRLAPGGSTHGSAGIELAYEQAAAGFIPGGVNRVILATDGDLNVGVTSDDALVDLIRRKAAGGTFLTVLGVGTGNLQDAKMEKLADNGNGVYAYLDGIREARKVLVEQLAGSTITIAKDVKIQVEFNPARVAAYRLLGYENRALAAADFRDDRKDAGEIGAGHAVTALYEIVPVGAAAPPADGAEPLRYQPRPEPAAGARPAAEASPELLTVKLRSKRPDGDTSTLVEVPLTDAGGSFERAAADFRFASAVAAFGMLLRGSQHAGTLTLGQVATIAGGALGPDPGGYRAEFLDLVRKAEAAGGPVPRE